MCIQVLHKAKQRITIQAAHTYIVEEDGGIAMAQLANLPSRLFHILFGQSPERWINSFEHTLKLWSLEEPFWVYDGEITSEHEASETS